jgi:hypothetical protein
MSDSLRAALSAPTDTTATMEAYTALRARLYPVTVSFTRTFKRGALDGLSIPQTVSFPSVADAESWIAGVANHPEISGAVIV